MEKSTIRFIIRVSFRNFQLGSLWVFCLRDCSFAILRISILSKHIDFWITAVSESSFKFFLHKFCKKTLVSFSYCSPLDHMILQQINVPITSIICFYIFTFWKLLTWFLLNYCSSLVCQVCSISKLFPSKYNQIQLAHGFSG